MIERNLSRREALGGMASVMIGGTALRINPPEPLSPRGEPRLAQAAPAIGPIPGDDLTSSAEFGEQARLVLPPDVFATVEGGDREPFNRIRFQPRINRPGSNLDLSVTLFGERHFTPVMIGPVANLRRYHPEGELGMVRGAAAAGAAMIVSSRTSTPLREIKANAYSPVWYAVYSEPAAAEQARAAAGDGATVIVLSTARGDADGSPAAATGPLDTALIGSVARAAGVPVVVKGALSPQEAEAALQAGARGIMVSTHGDQRVNGRASMDLLPPIVAAVGNRATILLDGSVQRGTDVLKALLLGARGVVVARPAVWALAAYGADGVLWMTDLIQNELARSAIMVGVQSVGEMTAEYVKIHREATA